MGIEKARNKLYVNLKNYLNNNNFIVATAQEELNNLKEIAHSHILNEMPNAAFIKKEFTKNQNFHYIYMDELQIRKENSDSLQILLHELGHASGVNDMLNRQAITKDFVHYQERCNEEILVESASLMILQRLNLVDKQIECRCDAYINSYKTIYSSNVNQTQINEVSDFVYNNWVKAVL